MRLKGHAFKTFGILALAVTLFSVLPGPTAHAVEIAIEPATVENPVVLWQFLTGSLVFLMPAGLAMLATGLTRAKNASHTAFMTFFGCAIAIIGFWIGGFAVMRGGSGFFLRHLGNDPGKFRPFFWKAALLWAGGFSWIFLKIADKFTMRVVPEVELEGLDIPETGLVGYPDLQLVSPHTSGFSGGMMRRTPRGE
jgi:hypothetical protein